MLEWGSSPLTETRGKDSLFLTDCISKRCLLALKKDIAGSYSWQGAYLGLKNSHSFQKDRERTHKYKFSKLNTLGGKGSCIIFIRRIVSFFFFCLMLNFYFPLHSQKMPFSFLPYKYGPLNGFLGTE